MVPFSFVSDNNLIPLHGERLSVFVLRFIHNPEVAKVFPDMDQRYKACIFVWTNCRRDVTASHTACANPCKHDTGNFHTIRFWIFSKRIFVCEKCFTVLDAKTMREI